MSTTKENYNSEKINKGKGESEISKDVVDGSSGSGLKPIYVSFEFRDALCKSMVEKVVSIIKRNKRGIINRKIRGKWDVGCRNVNVGFSGGCPGNVGKMVFPKNRK